MQEASSTSNDVWVELSLVVLNTNEFLYIDILSGWQLASPYTTSNPINKEVGSQSKWIWIMLLIGGGLVYCIRIIYPIRNLSTQENSTDIVT